ncbi:uncharacterized protein [Maniola hyperantus]|uniref:uncharacterized protein n=1 Tax=Aphantopus hyperantus TaxID=2795564 RepID=UPI00156929CF|nr:uncharacterized protein LOC117995487 [Maniola hyperantus]
MENPSLRCINCSIRLRFLPSQSLNQLDEETFNTLATWVTPTPISREDVICMECFTALQNALQAGPAPAPLFGHRSVCFACGTSTLRTRTSPVHANSAERNVILRWVSPHLVPHLERVCQACRLAARRIVRRHLQQDANRGAVIHAVQVPELEAIQAPAPEAAQAPAIQAVQAPAPEAVQAPPPEAVQDPAPEAVQAPEPPPLPPHNLFQPQRRQEQIITSRKYKRVASTTRHCLFPDCRNVERYLIPRIMKETILSRHRIYIPPCARVCNLHLNWEYWDQLRARHTDFTSSQMDNMLDMLEKISLSNKIDFSNVHSIPPNLCHYWLGLNATQFYNLLNSIPQLYEKVPDASVALSIYLTKLRTGDSNERLTGLFNMPRSTLERNMNKARNVLTERLVPLHLGLRHMTISEVAARNTVIPEGLYGNNTMPIETKPAITICDATYVYVQSSSNYLFQKQTYSLHKYTNLVKPFMIVCCDGHILDCLGPYKATTNDASIMSKEFSSAEGTMRLYFREGDVFILDRGFRDVVAQLQGYGYQTHMPESLLEGQHQLTTRQANKSRCVTMCRWVVEVVNGRIKRDFKLFRQDYFNKAAKHLMEDFRIACALTNKFHPVIEDKQEYYEYLEIAKQRLNMPNHLADIVQREQLNRRRSMFQNIDGDHPHLEQFPRLTIEQLKKFALGTYQLKQARSYYGEHIRQDGTYVVEINESIEEDLPLVLGVNNYLLRGRVKSRHVSSRTYYTYLLINKNEENANTLSAISGYCCSCLVGNRTVGCCAHIMTVTWYLSWGRHNDIQAPAQYLDDIFEEYCYENE